MKVQIKGEQEHTNRTRRIAVNKPYTSCAEAAFICRRASICTEPPAPLHLGRRRPSHAQSSTTTIYAFYYKESNNIVLNKIK